MPSLSLLDFSFIAFETAKTPMHVTGLVILDPPEEHAGTYAQELYASFLQQPEMVPPFNWKLNWSLTGRPSWTTVNNVNLEDHLRITMLPSPGNEQQLQQVVGRLHSQVLDRSRPMWEVWVIGGLENNRVALVLKIHHSMADGVRASKIFTQSCSTSVEESFSKPLWQCDLRKTPRQRREESHLTDMVMKTAVAATKQISLIPSMFRLGSKLALKAVNLADCDLKVPFTAPKTPFNLSPKRSRAVSLGHFSISQLKHISRITGASMNDILFTISDIALNRYLNDRAIPIRKPLVAMMPINLRAKGDEGKSGNKMSIGHVELGRQGLSPLQRLESIQHATTDLKNEALNISPDAYINYSLLVNGVSLFSGKFGLNNYIPPASNLLISNVPGAKEELYFMGAKVREQYPVSLLMPGQTLNITFFSNADTMYFSLVACNQSLPGFEVITDYMCDAFAEIEQEVMETAAQAVAEQLGYQHDESLAVELAVEAAQGSLTPEDDEFERLYQEKQRKVEQLEKQLARLTEMLSATVEIDPETPAKNQDELDQAPIEEVKVGQAKSVS
ncbi:wax ester/triacylglycerol synthase family O-acyltransferase [Photobacterium sp. DA100]|uniref:wax ester/triacylglycerol synthase family O-acyltransferase n=1 Tax=Photobacterium sp. DA100 TaxID=3027472 RepID=UPI00247AF314|nr:wax ester/triacylglycerol synthase family O-acyltransferase [Photobacterium sp. DA100]WEM41206.1 wax ester/triacylglycerol synthase family O-acyltransferase [Photobacterium sp. DA100]